MLPRTGAITVFFRIHQTLFMYRILIFQSGYDQYEVLTNRNLQILHIILKESQKQCLFPR